MTPTTPYYAVIFTSVLKEENQAYTKMAIKMVELAKEQKGFLGIESAREEIGVTRFLLGNFRRHQVLETKLRTPNRSRKRKI